MEFLFFYLSAERLTFQSKKRNDYFVSEEAPHCGLAVYLTDYLYNAVQKESYIRFTLISKIMECLLTKLNHSHSSCGLSLIKKDKKKTLRTQYRIGKQVNKNWIVFF